MAILQMKRRALIAALGGAAAWPVVVRAEQEKARADKEKARAEQQEAEAQDWRAIRARENAEKAKKFSTLLVWSEHYNQFIATVPALPDCEASGRTRLEAADRIENEIKKWIEKAAFMGRPVPNPSVRSRIVGCSATDR